VGGKFQQAEIMLQKGKELAIVAEHKRREIYYRRHLAYLFLQQNKFQEALQEITIAFDIAVTIEDFNHQRHSLHEKGLILAAMNSLDKAAKIAEKIKELVLSSPSQKYMRLYYHLLGFIELKQQNYKEAIEFFEQAYDLHPQECPGYSIYIVFIEPFAQSYHLSGKLKKAQELYEKMTELSVGRLWKGDIYSKSFYNLGQLYEQRGYRGKAIDSYTKFLKLWKDADPGLPEVDDTKQRLAGLKGE
jgi:tetratricopeptide (TPR) repeat protein